MNLARTGTNVATVSPPQDASFESADQDTRYRRARREWDERFSYHAQSARHWRLVALVALIGMIICAGYAVWAGVMSRHKPYLVMVDELGRATAATEVRTEEDWPPKVIKRELLDFVSNFRSVPGDEYVLRANMRKVLKYTAPGLPADKMIRDIGLNKTIGPFTVFKTRTVSVEVISVNYVSGMSWLVEWRETTRNRNTGAISGVGRFKGTFVLQRAAELSPEVITDNPLGVIVEYFDIQKLE